MYFHTIKTSEEGYPMEGYRFVGKAEVNMAAYKRAFPNDTEIELENRIGYAVDDFYDGWDDICTHGTEMYSVHRHWETNEPLIWCRIKREE